MPPNCFPGFTALPPRIPGTQSGHNAGPVRTPEEGLGFSWEKMQFIPPLTEDHHITIKTTSHF